MSTQEKIKLNQQCKNTQDKQISLTIDAQQKDLGGFKVFRVLPAAQKKMIGPWIFVDEMGPADFDAGDGINVRPHPHINLATVTYLFRGQMEHRDSLGSDEVIQPGDVNIMVAGRGIAHSERQGENINHKNHHLHGLQLWLALPEADEETDPSFHHYSAEDIPQFTRDSAHVRLIIGELFDHRSPVKTFSETLYAVFDLPKNKKITLPKLSEYGVYVISGRLKSNQQTIKAQTMALMNHRNPVHLQAEEDTRFVILGGAPLGNRYIEWNFVSSRKERIEQAKDDWKNQRFEPIPGDNEEFIPLP